MSPFPDFSPAGYADLLRYLRGLGYALLPFRDGVPLVAARQRVCLLRHDVDLSPQCALRLARIEAAENVRSTYFFLVNSDFYSVASRVTEAALREIVALGHEIGFHWWASRYPAPAAEFDKLFQLHVRLLEAVAGTSIVSAAQHDPTSENPRVISHLVPHNAYDPRYIRDIAYLSDSNRAFRTPVTSLAATRPAAMQINLHPLFWTSGGDSMADCFRRGFQLELDQMQDRLSSDVASYERALADRQERDRRFQEKYVGSTDAPPKRAA